MTKIKQVGTFQQKYNDVLGTTFPIHKIVQSVGLQQHLYKNNHANCLTYLNKISDILNDPTYIGKNARHADSIEIVRKYSDNVLVALKLNNKNGYWFVASVYDVSDSKIQRRLHSGRLKKY